MNVVIWIWMISKIEDIKAMIIWKWKIKNLILFHLWITTWLRIWDLLKLKIWNIFDENWEIRKTFEIKDNKTKKRNLLLITNNVKKNLLLYIEKYPYILSDSENYLFHNEKKYPLWRFWISRVHAWKVIKTIFHDVWLTGKFWTHSLRKTFWLILRKKGIPLSIIQHKLNHSSPAVTKRYLWITDSEANDIIEKLNI